MGEYMAEPRDIAAGRCSAPDLAKAFADLHAPLTDQQAFNEAGRCFYCHDAPCLEACPTSIDIPGFIRRIATGNATGAGRTILDSNIMGATCARVCPVEELCEEVCVRNTGDHKPVTIAQLQRYATDSLFEAGMQPYARAAATGKKIAVVGAGPAGLACAHRLARYGHDVVVYDAKAKAGGLNEYGLAAYKMPDNIAQREIDFIMSVGGITIETGKALGVDVMLDQLRADHDVVFLGFGLGAVNALGLQGEDVDAVEDAVDYISELRQADDLTKVTVGRRVVVIGGGNTAIDAAVQAKRLGAEEVTLVYRRGPEQMGATGFEQDLAQTNGVVIRHWAKPVGIEGENGSAVEMTFEATQLDGNNRLEGTGATFTLTADQVFKAIGQTFDETPIQGAAAPDVSGGRIVVDDERKTSLHDVYAGGDCVEGQDLTVSAVEDGKIAAEAIHQQLIKGAS
jgi:dihydropyrimidine dehydrogenase (NAD+) subunit PreT